MRVVVESPLLLRAGPDPTWLPPGSRADVLLGSPPPDEPTGLVRLLVVRGDAFFCVPRDDGRTDLPTRHVAPGEDPQEVARALASVVLGPQADVRPWGYVRNLVLEPDADYPWPTPVACFSVWRSAAGTPVVPGGWVSRTELGERHWWPLAEHALRQRRRDSGDQPSVPDR